MHRIQGIAKVQVAKKENKKKPDQVGPVDRKRKTEPRAHTRDDLHMLHLHICWCKVGTTT